MPDMLVRFKKGKTHFEVLTKEGAVTKYRDGELTNLDDVVVTPVIFTNQSKGERANTELLRSTFETDDLTKCLEAIVSKGEYQLSAGERKAKVDGKRREIVDYFRKYYVEPKSKLPLPVTRIENALTEAKIRIDPDQPAMRQAQDISAKLTAIMPMSKMTLDGSIHLPHASIGAATGVIGKYCQVAKEGYTADGCTMHVSIAPGDYDALISDLNKATKGNFTFDIDTQGKTMASGNVSSEPQKKAGRGGGSGKKSKKRG